LIEGYRNINYLRTTNNKPRENLKEMGALDKESPETLNLISGVRQNMKSSPSLTSVNTMKAETAGSRRPCAA
jgi:hypothetical protein